MLTGVLADAHPPLATKKIKPQGDAQCCNLRRKKLQLAIGKASTGYEKSFNQYTTGAMDDQEKLQEKLQPVTEKASSSDEKKLHQTIKKVSTVETKAMDEKLQPVTEKASSSDEKSFIRL